MNLNYKRISVERINRLQMKPITMRGRLYMKPLDGDAFKTYCRRLGFKEETQQMIKSFPSFQLSHLSWC
jgi:hypothetical protein